MIADAVKKILAGQHLTADESEQTIEAILTTSDSTGLVAAFMTALRMKGETAEEILGAARALRSRVTRITHRQEVLVDNCGTGGDGAGTFNISTTAAFVLAGAGLAVGKHGNRGVSSKSGSADVLRALGARIDLTPTKVAACIDNVGIGFMFAPSLHPAMKAVAPVRKELGFRTIFNLLGPLVNPAFVTHQVIGVYASVYTEPIARVASALGLRRAYVVHNEVGIDELAPTGVNLVSTMADGNARTYQIDPAAYGFRSCRLDDLAGGTPEDNARITRAVLRGEEGPAHDTVVLNAAMGLYAGEKAASLAEGLSLARAAIDSGKALVTLNKFIAYTCELADAQEDSG